MKFLKICIYSVMSLGLRCIQVRHPPKGERTHKARSLCKARGLLPGGEVRVGQLMLTVRAGTGGALPPAWGRRERIQKSFFVVTPEKNLQGQVGDG